MGVGVCVQMWCFPIPRFQQSFHGVDLSSLRSRAYDEYFHQPVVDTFDLRVLMAKPVRHIVNFLTTSETDLEK